MGLKNGNSSKVEISRKHIGRLKTEAYLLAVQNLLPSPSNYDHKNLNLIDNTSTLGAVTTGGASYWSLNKVCRKIDHFSHL